jgi:hypothetical protein
MTCTTNPTGDAIICTGATKLGPISAKQLAAWRMHHVKQTTLSLLNHNYNQLLRLGKHQTIDEYVEGCLLVGSLEKVQTARRAKPV